jgi:hypothetical protein
VVETCKVPADRVVITITRQLVNKAVGGVLFADHLTLKRSTPCRISLAIVGICDHFYLEQS